MTYPIFDKSVLPFIVCPFSSAEAPVVKFLGYKATTGERSITVKFIAVDGIDSEKHRALYDFWKTDCNYGTKPFLISLPWMGSPFDNNYPNLLVKFTGGISSSFDGIWSTKQKLVIVGEVNRIGELITPDTKTINWS